MAWIAALFFAVALCYSSVGFGGGSSYTAILAWQGAGTEVIRQVSLLCNLVVVVIGGVVGWRQVRWRLMLPLLTAAVPAVFFSARWHLSDEVFFVVLAVALAVAGVLMFLKPPPESEPRDIPTPILLGLGGLLGALAGVTGIGGGIYLAPVLFLMRAGKAHEIAAVATWFILVNSAVGFAVISVDTGLASVRDYFWLPVAVAGGGVMGARLLQGTFREVLIRRMTGGLILVVAVRLLI